MGCAFGTGVCADRKVTVGGREYSCKIETDDKDRRRQLLPSKVMSQLRKLSESNNSEEEPDCSVDMETESMACMTKGTTESACCEGGCVQPPSEDNDPATGNNTSSSFATG